MANPSNHERLGEFDIIARYFAPLATDPASLGLTDDGALLPTANDETLVLTTDTLIESVHFLRSDPPDSIGHKALAVNLSDLAAMAATPKAYLLALSLPVKEGALLTPPEWLEALASGMKMLQERANIALIGGDTTATPGPLSLTVTAIGSVERGKAPLRSTAKQGDLLYVSGSIGDAVLGLKLLRNPELARQWGFPDEETAALIERDRRPQPRIGLAQALRDCANAAMDISDGLAGDLDKICVASGLSASVEAADVPLSQAARKVCTSDPDMLTTLLSGGDDYEILAAIPPDRAQDYERLAAASGIAVTAIGKLEAGQGTSARFIAKDGHPLEFKTRSFGHF